MAGLPASLVDVVRAGIDARLEDVFTALPATVTVYDPVTNTAFVKLAVKHGMSTDDGDRVFEEYPEIPFVPVLFPRAGGFVMRTPIEEGDGVLLVFSRASMAEWRSNGQVGEPQDARLFSFGWPVAIPGLFPDDDPMNALDSAQVAAGAMIVGEDGGAQMRFGGTVPGVKFAPAGVEPVSPIALSVPTDAALSTVTTAHNALVASFNAFVAKYNGHTHPVPGVTTGTGATTSSAPGSGDQASAAAAGPSTPATTASTLVKST